MSLIDERNRKHAEQEEPLDFEPKEMTPWQRIGNFFYYHKWHVLIILFVAVAVGLNMYHSSRRVAPDYTVILFLNDDAPTITVDALASALYPYAEDVNGDGQLYIDVTDYSNTGEIMTRTAAMMQALMIDLDFGDTVIYVTDDVRFDYLDDYLSGDTGGFAELGIDGLENQTRWEWSGSDIKNDNFRAEEGNVYFCVRNTDAPAFEKTDNAALMQQTSVELVRRLAGNERVDSTVPAADVFMQ